MTLTAYEVHAPQEFASVVAHCTSEREARAVARTRSAEHDGIHYVHGPEDGFREFTAQYHDGNER